MQLHYPLNPTTGVEDQTQLPWTNGVPQTGQEGSYPPFALCTEPMYEIVNALVQAGIVPSSSDSYQLTRAIRGGQLDFAGDAGTADAMVVAIQLPHTQVRTGLPFTFVKGANPNATTSPTLTITGPSGASPISGPVRKINGGPLGIGDLPGAAMITGRFDGAGQFRLLSVLLASDVLALIQGNQAFQTAIGSPGRSALFTSSGSFQVPNGVTSVEAWLMSPGGAGGASADGSSGSIAGNMGGGGGGGTLAYRRLYNLAPLAIVPISIGAPGAPAASAAGGSGGTSSLGSYLSATGGSGGSLGTNTYAPGGAPGVATGLIPANGDYQIQGGTGGNSGSNSSAVTISDIYRVYGRGGGAAQYGVVDLAQSGAAGHGFGAGGSGASGGSGLAGGAGAPSFCFIRW